MLFPFVEEELEKIATFRENEDVCDDAGVTATCALKFWHELRRIVLQDAAELSIRFPDRESHCLFRIPVFQTTLFLVSFSG